MGKGAGLEDHVHLCSSSDHSDIVTLGDSREAELGVWEEPVAREDEETGNEELYLGTSSSSQYTFSAVETSESHTHTHTYMPNLKPQKAVYDFNPLHPEKCQQLSSEMLSSSKKKQTSSLVFLLLFFFCANGGYYQRKCALGVVLHQNCSVSTVREIWGDLLFQETYLYPRRRLYLIFLLWLTRAMDKAWPQQLRLASVPVIDRGGRVCPSHPENARGIELTVSSY